jgi:hypothetical protein
MIKAVLAIALFSSSPAWAAEQCKSVFSDGIQLNSSAFDPAKQNDIKQVPAMLSRILQMSASTLNESMSPKYTLEKGEITLGHTLGDGWTLEFNYKRDARTSDVTFRLTDIQVLQPNGDAVKLTKNPTTPEGTLFAKENISIADLVESKIKIPLSDVLVNVDAPVVIRGELLKSLEKWIPYLEYVKRDSLRSLEASGLGKLKTKAFVKSNAAYTQDIIKKQSFKFVLLGVAMYVYLQKDQVIEYFVEADPWPKLLDDSSFEKLSTVEQKQVARLLKDSIDLELTDELANFNKHKKSSSIKSYNDVSEILNKTNELKQAEKKSGGSAQVYIFKNGKSAGGSLQKVLNLLNSENDDQFVLTFVYPATKRMLVVTNTMMQEKTEESFLTVAIDGAQDRDLYVAIKNKLKKIQINE